MPELTLFQNKRPSLRFPITSSTTKIGRSLDCDLTLAEPSISRVQLIIYESDSSYFIKNVGKAPCTLNGKDFTSSALKESDSLTLGAWEIVFSLSSASATWSYEETQLSGLGELIEKDMRPSVSSGFYFAEKVSLILQEPDRSPRTFTIQQESTILGHLPSCDIVLFDASCAEKHCKIELKKNQVILTDLNSQYGSWINGVRIREAFLEDGYQVRVGKTEITVEFQSKKKKIKPKEVHSLGPMVGSSRPMQELYHLIEQVAPTDATVCILGETGVGKELVARILHDLSPRKLKPWVPLNCGAISKELIESELFGHEKGAFTGAHQQRKGAFEQAHGGTLFLDEIGELPLHLQPTLLRVLETGRVRRVGASSEIAVDVRVLCATHRDLSQLVNHGQFREDLFFRLYVFPILIPSLREREEDILPLAGHFLRTMAPLNRQFYLSPEAAEYLKEQDWRGNVRELKNVIQRAIVLASEDKIKFSDVALPRLSAAQITGALDRLKITTRLEDLEKEAILRELKIHQGNRKATAQALGIAKSTLYEKIKLYGIQD